MTKSRKNSCSFPTWLEPSSFLCLMARFKHLWRSQWGVFESHPTNVNLPQVSSFTRHSQQNARWHFIIILGLSRADAELHNCGFFCNFKKLQHILSLVLLHSNASMPCRTRNNRKNSNVINIAEAYVACATTCKIRPSLITFYTARARPYHEADRPTQITRWPVSVKRDTSLEISQG